jgi:AAA ATPase domain
MAEWAELPERSSDRSRYADDFMEPAGAALSKVFECFKLDESRDLATELSQRRSNWGRIVSSGGFSAEDRILLQRMTETVGATVLEKSARLTSVGPHIGKLPKHFRSAVKTVELHAINPDVDELVRQTEMRVQDKVGPMMPMSLQGSGIRSAASILSFDARISLHRGSPEFRIPLLLLEEPETHLHPVAQRSLAQLLGGLAGQMILTSHSPSIASELANTICPLTSLRILRTNGEVNVPQVDSNTANTGELQKALRIIRANQGECFFASVVIVVEGTTEYSALPVFADLFFGEQESLATRAVTIISAGSKDSIPGLLRSISRLGIPAIGLVDADGVSKVTGLLHAVSDPDWEAALLSDSDRMAAVLDFVTEASLDRFVADRIKSAENKGGTFNDSTEKSQKAALTKETERTQQEWLATYLKKNHKDESAALVAKHMLETWPAPSSAVTSENWQNDRRFPKAVIEVLEFVESATEA